MPPEVSFLPPFVRFGKWTFYAGLTVELLLSVFVLFGMLYGHMWAVAAQQCVRTCFMAALALGLQRGSQQRELPQQLAQGLHWGAIAVVILALFDTSLLIQYDIALGRLSH